MCVVLEAIVLCFWHVRFCIKLYNASKVSDTGIVFVCLCVSVHVCVFVGV